MSSVSTVFNETGVDRDFRVESDSFSSALFVDAGNNTVSIDGSGTHQIRTTNGTPLRIYQDSNNGDAGLQFGSDDVVGAPTSERAKILMSASGNNAGSLLFYTRKDATGSRKALTIDSNQNVIVNDDSYDADFRVESDSNANAFFVNGGNSRVGIGTNAPDTELHVHGTSPVITIKNTASTENSRSSYIIWRDGDGGQTAFVGFGSGGNDNFSVLSSMDANLSLGTNGQTHVKVDTGETVVNEDSRDYDFRVESNGNANMLTVDASTNAVGVGKFGSTGGASTNGAYFNGSVINSFHFVVAHTSSTSTDAVQYLNRQSSDGRLLELRQADQNEVTISVSGSTVSYNGFAGRHESSGISATTQRGTVVSTIDELDTYLSGPKQGQTRADHAKVKVSDVAGEACVYGVVDDFDEDDKVNVISVGIAPVLVTGACAKGDLLESNGDGTAKVQDDDIVRSKTIGKVTIGNSDTGVKLVSCVMYCG